MKRFLMLGLAALSLMAYGCGDSKPQVRVDNQLADKVNVSFQPDASSTINLNDVSSATTSDYVDLPEGMARIHVSTTASAPPDLDYTFVKGKKYTLLIVPGPPATMSMIQN